MQPATRPSWISVAMMVCVAVTGLVAFVVFADAGKSFMDLLGRYPPDPPGL